MIKLKDGRKELFQWDTNRYLEVDNDCTEVHFATNHYGRSKDVQVVSGEARIPDELLQSGNNINVWAFVGTSEDGYTKISAVFPVIARNKPADYMYTPTDQTTLAEIRHELEEIKEQQDPEAIKNAISEYLEENPIKETDPNVPDWAKEAEKPKYTADEVGAVSVDKLGDAVDDALAEAKASGMFDGKDGQDGQDGEDGYTPQKGVDYFDGKDGADGKDGKTAYQYAQDGGYTGSETEFAKKLAEEYPEVPTRLSQLENDQGFITNIVSDLVYYYKKTETYSAKEIDERISAIPKFAISVVSSLPASKISETTVYLLKSSDESENLYTEYIYTNGNWEILGEQRVDLTGYAMESWVSGQLASYMKTSELQSAVNAALEQAKASGEFDGEDGKDGKDGINGTDGVSIASVVQTTTSSADGGENVVTVTLSDDAKFTFKVKNGSRGSDGAAGKDGTDGTDGDDGEDGNGIASAVLNADYTLTLTFTDGTSYTTPSIRGATGAAGKDGSNGTNGTSVTVSNVSESSASGGTSTVTFSDGKTLNVKNGKDGSDGKDGEDGRTPVKGTDYFTAEDIQRISAQATASLNYETWTFELEDGTTVTKKVVLGEENAPT